MVRKSTQGGRGGQSGETPEAAESTAVPRTRRPRTPPPSAMRKPEPARAARREQPTPPLAAAAVKPASPEPAAKKIASPSRRVRTPPPPPVPPRDASARPARKAAAAPEKPAKSAEPHVIPKPALSNGKDSRLRTPRPAAAEADQEQQSPEVLAVINKMTEPMNQLRFLQDFYLKPPAINLGAAPVESSTPPEEVTKRMSEVKYQLNVLDALQAVLKEEMKELERSLPSRDASAVLHRS